MSGGSGADLAPLGIEGAVAVVTGGANGIGKGIVRALLERGATVVIADIEEPVLDATVAELRSEFEDAVSGRQTDVSDEASVEALADHVFTTFGRCNVLFNNAGVGSGGGGKAWTNEPNDWKWCFGVNVFGTAHGVISFVPRMIESGQPGHVVNTSSGDGGFAPVPMASVYASSKAAVSCFTEALNHQLLVEAEGMGASVFYPSGGLMNTGLFTAQRNRPDHLQRVRGGTGRAGMTFDELKTLLEKAGRDVKVADLDELGRFVVDSVSERRYIIARDLDDTIDLLHRRADAIGRFEVPPHHDMGL
ncbi:MAG: SDR family NAD(P)-dependent oxidoreductase [Acidimicrobiales bacterium]|nr:SDR family NAD(P)-dependent oxidoreductase [Acidimicrobiales bacterium]MDP6759270.1 SDR family NAD(P)-dependent oxidoreductase [Acidimicrobiales bacterium]